MLLDFITHLLGLRSSPNTTEELDDYNQPLDEHDPDWDYFPPVKRLYLEELGDEDEDEFISGCID